MFLSNNSRIQDAASKIVRVGRTSGNHYADSKLDKYGIKEVQKYFKRSFCFEVKGSKF
jgi:hypothetical protein